MLKQPNVILILTDQLRSDCVSLNGNEYILTPNIDTVGGQGINFSNAYSATPSCIAARRSIMSGMSPQKHGMVGYKDFLEWDAVTLPQILKDNGYQTYMVGRNIHLHPTRKRYGFDHMVVNEDYLEWVDNKVDGVKFNRYATNKHHGGIYYSTGIQCCDYTARPWPYEEYLHHTNWTVNKAIDFLEKKDPSVPFFLVVSFLAPHPPLIPPKFYMDRYLRNDLPKPKIGNWEEVPNSTGQGLDSFDVNLSDEAIKSMQAGYYGLINHIDDQIRRFIKISNNHVSLMTNQSDVKDEQDNNTIVLFTSDHGEMLGDHYLRRKSTGYQGSMKIPFMLRAPEQYNIKPGSINNQLVSLNDIMPTILGMLDIDIPETCDGKNLYKSLQDNNHNTREYIHIEHAPRFQGIVTETDKFLWHVKSGKEQYFDLKNDPDELDDLINDHLYKDRINKLRFYLINELINREEGFTDGKVLISGQPYFPVLKKEH